MAVALKWSISDLLLVKPKCVWEVVVFFSIFENLLTFFYCLFSIFLKKNYQPLNTFWLYHHGVKYAPFPCYSNLLLIISFQALTLLVLTPLFFMTIAKMTMPTWFNKYVSTEGCQFFATIWVTHTTLLITCGFVMALYRLTCMNGKRYGVKYFIVSTLALELLSIHANYSHTNTNGWETSAAYRYCIDYQLTEEKTSRQNPEKGMYSKMLIHRSTALALTISEFGIYLYILRNLWTTDKKNHKDKIITANMLKARKEKNVSTLKGQICIFITKAAIVIWALFMLFSGHRVFADEKSAAPFMLIIPYSIISFSQVLSSHEFRRYVNVKFEWENKGTFLRLYKDDQICKTIL